MVPLPLMDLQDRVRVLEQDQEEDQPRGGLEEVPELDTNRGVAPAPTGKGKNEVEMTFRALQPRNRSKFELSGINNLLQSYTLSIYQLINESVGRSRFRFYYLLK